MNWSFTGFTLNIAWEAVVAAIAGLMLAASILARLARREDQS